MIPLTSPRVLRNEEIGMSVLEAVVIDPNRLCRRGLEHVFAGTAYRIAMEFDEVTEGITAIERSARPDLVILDFRHPSEANADDVRALRRALAAVPIVLLTNELTPARVASLFEAGLTALLFKDSNDDALVRYLDLVMTGETIIHGGFVAGLLGTRADDEGRGRPAAPDALTRREMEVVEHLIDGHSNKVIAHTLGVTEATVKVHLKAIMKKTGATNRTQVAIQSLRNPLLQADRPPDAASATGLDRPVHASRSA
jgi:two-component system, NarL family, nitrate/nitrite response regulator NarL